MIVKTGIVVITGGDIKAEGFVFDGSDGKNATIGFLEWAIQRLEEQKRVQERVTKNVLLGEHPDFVIFDELTTHKETDR